MANKILSEFADTFQHCWSCGVGINEYYGKPLDGIDYPRGLTIHHICRGNGRKNERGNLSRLCQLCHDLAHDYQIKGMMFVRDRIMARQTKPVLPILSLSNVLWLKLVHDGPLDRKLLAQLLGRASTGVPRAVRPHWFLESLYIKRHHRYPEVARR